MPSACPLVYEDPCAQTLLEDKTATRHALFLDRDGVINEEMNYVHEIRTTFFVPGIFELCTRAQKNKFLLMVLTNQAGIARGLYAESEFMHYTAWVHEEFARRGIILAATFACPHHPSKGLGAYLRDCTCRKPNPGMFMAAAARYDIDLGLSAMIGDKPSDMAAARAAGVGQTYLVGDAGLAPALAWFT